MENLRNGLFVVGTPIGNLGDMPIRAKKILKGVNKIACEDTRVTGKLLSKFSIETPMAPYHDHNADKVRPGLISEMKNGSAIALVSDAGMPAISDPGYKLVRDCIEADVPLTVIPGPNAALTALVQSGLPTDRFLFQGYLPSKSGARVSELQVIANVPATLIFYESARRLSTSLTDMAKVLGNRPAAVARELTKIYEEVRRGTIAELASHYLTTGSPRGEIVIIVAPPEKPSPPDSIELGTMIAQRMEYMSVKDAAAEVARITGLSRKFLYGIGIKLRRELEASVDDKNCDG